MAEGTIRAERVELQLESKIPGRQQIAGITHVVEMLSEIERRIDRINKMRVAPQGLRDSKDTSRAIKEQEEHTRAIERTIAAKGRLIKTTEQLNRATGERARTDVYQTGPGRTSAYTSSGKSASEKHVTDYSKMGIQRSDPTYGLTGKGFAGNVAKFVGWGGAVGTVLTGANLAREGAKSAVNIQSQQARLSQVYQGNDVEKLTDDVLKLGAAENRTAEESMESAIQWARLQLNRIEIQDAVRASMVAANVAEISAADATKRMSSLMVVYNLKASELMGTLGMLNNTSNKYNVTNAELYDGLSRTASVAKLAGISLADLQGLIGATVGRTGSSGSQVGNALKSILTSMNSPNTQDFLRENYGLDALDGSTGKMKSGSQRLKELFIRYQSMSDTEKGGLTERVAGKTQATRFAGMLESYLPALERSIDAQKNLNSAEVENIRIKSALKSQLVGLRTEMERGVYAAATRRGPGGGSAMGTISESIKFAGNAFRLDTNLKSNPYIGGALGTFTSGGLAYHGLRIANNVMDPTGSFLDTSTGRVQAVQGLAGAESTRTMGLEAILGSMGAPTALLRAQQGRGIVGSRGDELIELVRGGKTGAASKLLADEISGSKSAAATASEKELAVTSEETSKLTAQLRILESKKAAYSDIQRVQTQLNDLINRQVQLMQAPGNGETYEAMKRRVMEFNEELKHALSSIQEIMSLSGGSTSTDALNLKIRTLQEQERAASFAYDQMDGRTVLGKAAKDKAAEELAEIRSQLAGSKSPQSRAMAAEFDRRSSLKMVVGMGVGGMGIGGTEAEQMVDKIKSLDEMIERQKELTRLDGVSLSDSEKALAIQVAVDAIMASKLQKDQMIVALGKEQKNLAVELNREYSKSMLMAGPGDLLRKLAVKQSMDSGKMTLGSFMAMSPEAKQDAAALNPLINSRGQDIRSSLGVLGPKRTYQQVLDDNDRYGKITAENYNNTQSGASMGLILASAKAELGLEAAGAKAYEVAAAFKEMLPTLARFSILIGGRNEAKVQSPIDNSTQGAEVEGETPFSTY